MTEAAELTGEALDRAIHRALFDKVPRRSHLLPDGTWSEPTEMPTEYEQTPPPYSTTWKGMGLVVAAMQAKRVSVRERFADHLHRIVAARMGITHGLVYGPHLILYVTPEDACRAALAALGG